MYRVFRAFFIGLYCVSSIASGTTAGPTDTIGNFGTVTYNVYRGERLNEEADYQELRSLGVQTVINLESLHEDDPGLCSHYGLNCVRFPIPLLGFPKLDKFFDYEMLEKAFQFLIDENHKNKKVYFHCHYGSDRTGALASAMTIRLNYCGDKSAHYDAGQVWEKVKSDLSAYGYHEALYKNLKSHIKSWVYSPPPWICAPPTESAE